MPHVLSLPGWSLRPKPCVRGLPSCRRAPLSPQAEHWAGYWQMQERSLSLRSRTLFPRGPLPPCSTSWRGVTWSQGWGGDCEGRRGGGWPSRRVPTRVVHAWLGCRPPTLTSRHLPAVSFLLDAARARWAPSPTPPSPPFISSHRKRKSSSCEAASRQPGRLSRGSGLGRQHPPPQRPPHLVSQSTAPSPAPSRFRWPSSALARSLPWA